MQKKWCRCLLPFEHNTRTWQTDSTGHIMVTSIAVGEITYQRCRLIMGSPWPETSQWVGVNQCKWSACRCGPALSTSGWCQEHRSATTQGRDGCHGRRSTPWPSLGVPVFVDKGSQRQLHRLEPDQHSLYCSCIHSKHCTVSITATSVELMH